MPDGIDRKAWDDFVSMRKAKGKRAPFTDAARDGIVARLLKLQQQGYDPNDALRVSTVNGWSDVFAPKVQPIRFMPTSAPVWEGAL